MYPEIQAPQGLTKADEDELLRVKNIRSLNCKNLLTFRSQIVLDIKEGLYIQSRNAEDFSTRLKLMTKAFEVVFNDTLFASNVENTMTIVSQLSWRLDGQVVPFLTQSMLRHHMQQFYHLQNTTVDKCSVSSSYRDIIVAQHGTCEGAAKKFLRYAESYKDVLRQLPLRNRNGVSSNNFDPKTAGLRDGASINERNERDTVYLDSSMLGSISETLFRHVHSSPSATALLPRGVFNKENPNWKRIENEWSENNGSTVLVIDDVFTEEGLTALREFSDEQTMWHTTKTAGYICAFLENGFATPLTAQATIELQDLIPTVTCDHKLSQAWGYKYPDGDMSDGISMHADYAAINVNCWTTSEEYIEEGTGGMIVHHVKPPDSWLSTPKYNGGGSNNLVRVLMEDGRYEMRTNSTQVETGGQEVMRFVREQDSKTLVVPYKSNRCVIFDSAYFHATDKVRFGNGYKSRRVNLTFLFGRAKSTCTEAATWRQTTSDATTMHLQSRAGE
jgi:hypothetical protein